MTYLHRVADDDVRRRLAANGAVLIEGPKACGKTETARRQAASEVLLDIDEAALQAAQIDPGLVLAGNTPRLIDEWQVVPGVWNRVRREVDLRQRPGQFILTGSAVPSDDERRHTGGMRFGHVQMRPMTLAETGCSSRQISLADVMDGTPTAAADTGLSIGDLVEEIVRGGWPGTRGLSLRDAAQAVRDYIDQISRLDIQRVDGVRRDPQRVAAVLRSVARNAGTQAAARTIAADSRLEDGSEEGGGAGYHTVRDYLSALARIFVIEDAAAWNTHLRSSHQLRTSPTRYFTDPSLAVAALRGTPETLLADLSFTGLLFESLVVRDLRVYAQPLDGAVYHYRDQTGLEVDAIVDCGVRWAAFEVKLGGAAQIEQAARSLRTFSARVDTSTRGEAAALCVIVATGYGYVREDGIRIIPIGCLGP